MQATIASPDHPNLPSRSTVPLSAALDVLVETFDFPPARARTIARRLQDAGALPLGTYSSPPMLSVTDFIALLLALCADCTLRETPAAVGEFAALGLTNAEGASAGAFLHGVAELALRGDLSVHEFSIEVIPAWREFVVRAAGDVTERFVAPGSALPHRCSHRRQSTTLTGLGLASAVRELFAS